MSIGRRDDWLTDAQGRALAGAEVWYCNQPADVSVLPPTPLTTVYTDTLGTVGTNPVITDGFGHAVAYLNEAVLYTIEYVHPLFGSNVVLRDQAINATGAGPFPSPTTPTPAPDGIVTTFTLPFTPVNPTTGLLFVAGSYVPYGAGMYTITGPVITWLGAVPPQTDDKIIYYGS